MKGTIKKLVRDKCFGFIEADGVEYFFHQSALQNAKFDHLEEKQAVEFQAGQGQKGKGPRAEDVYV